MNVHKNARLTPSGRALLVRRVSSGWTAKAAAEAAGVSLRTARKWIGRHRRGGQQRHRDRRAGRSRKAGWDFLHVCVDDASRLAYTEILPSERKEDTTAFLQRALAWLGRHGVTVQRVMTDNGSAYRSGLFRQAVADAGARHVPTRPHTPRTNSKAERCHHT